MSFRFVKEHIYANRMIRSSRPDLDVIVDFATDIPGGFQVLREESRKPVILKSEKQAAILLSTIEDPMNWDDFFILKGKSLIYALNVLERLCKARSVGRQKQWQRKRREYLAYLKANWPRKKTTLQVPRGLDEKDTNDYWVEPEGQDRTDDHFKANRAEQIVDILMTTPGWDWLTRESILRFKSFARLPELEAICEELDAPETPRRMRSYFRPTLVFQGKDDPIKGAAFALLDEGFDFTGMADSAAIVPAYCPHKKAFQPALLTALQPLDTLKKPKGTPYLYAVEGKDTRWHQSFMADVMGQL